MVRMSFAALLCLALLISGCGQSAEEKAVEKQIEKNTGSDATVDLSDNGMNIHGKTEDGEFSVSTGNEVAIPKDFPADIFVYRPSKTTMAMNAPEGYTLALTTEDAKAAVTAAYETEMKAKGWSQVTSMDMGQSSMLAYEKDNRSVNITLAASGKELQINVTASK